MVGDTCDLGSDLFDDLNLPLLGGGGLCEPGLGMGQQFCGSLRAAVQTAQVDKCLSSVVDGTRRTQYYALVFVSTFGS
jgi:hypothetical protein